MKVIIFVGIVSEFVARNFAISASRKRERRCARTVIATGCKCIRRLAANLPDTQSYNRISGNRHEIPLEPPARSAARYVGASATASETELYLNGSTPFTSSSRIRLGFRFCRAAVTRHARRIRPETLKPLAKPSKPRDARSIREFVVRSRDCPALASTSGNGP